MPAPSELTMKMSLGASNISSPHGAATPVVSACPLPLLRATPWKGEETSPPNGGGDAGAPLPFPLGQLALKWSSAPQMLHFIIFPSLSLGFIFLPCPLPEVWERFPLPLPLRNTDTSSSVQKNPRPRPFLLRPWRLRFFLKVRRNLRTGRPVYLLHILRPFRKRK